MKPINVEHLVPVSLPILHNGKKVHAFGFKGPAILKLMRNGFLYFVSWSGNWDSDVEFAPDPYFYDKDLNPKIHDGEGLIRVEVSSPYDVDAMNEEHAKFSNAEDLEEIRAAVAAWRAYDGPIKPYPLHLWLATKKKAT